MGQRREGQGVRRPARGEPPPPLRLFVAVYPPLALARRWVEAAALLDLPESRPTPEAQVHLTLQFIGPVERRDLSRVRESVERAASGLASFVLTPGGLDLFPDRARPRLIALRTDAPPALLELKRRLATRLARGSREDPADAYEPHLTLRRFSGNLCADAWARWEAREISDSSFLVEHVCLMSSVLHAGGSKHREVCRVGLLPRGGAP